ncbi:MAG: hypothetical protein ABFS43_18850, partial [Thermodesulfobacteriota bacterium]
LVLSIKNDSVLDIYSLFLLAIKGSCFSSISTTFYLRNFKPSDSIPADIQEKLNLTGLEDYFKTVISRNLKMFF